MKKTSKNNDPMDDWFAKLPDEVNKLYLWLNENVKLVWALALVQVLSDYFSNFRFMELIEQY